MSDLSQPLGLPPFGRTPLPRRFCNFERLMETMRKRELDALLIYTRTNVFYLSGYSPPSIQSLDETNALAAIIIPAADPSQAVLAIPEFDISMFVHQPTWIEDIRPYSTNP